jgi:hypothetical protein
MGWDGRIRWWAVVVLGPYLGLVWVVWRVQRWVSRERCADEIVPGVWVGRRPVCGEVPEGVGMVVDVTCEFAEPAAVLVAKGYAKDVDEAVRVLVGRRAGVRLSAGQRVVVERIWLRIDAESGRDAV